MEMTTYIRRLLEHELERDRSFDDVTTRMLPVSDRLAKGHVISKEAGAFCGELICEGFAQIFDQKVEVYCEKKDGDAILPGELLVGMTGTLEHLLSLERTMLNVLAHLCGIATLTKKFVDEVGKLPTKILATRKTLPGLRDLQLYAVRAGGGYVHRRALSDGILFKENHLAFFSPAEALTISKKKRSPLQRLEIEVQNINVLRAVLIEPPDIIMLDNLSLKDLELAIKMIDRKAEVEVSGGVTLDKVKAIAELGVQYISVGRLTHSAPAIDMSLDVSL